MRNLDWQDYAKCTPDMADLFTANTKPTNECINRLAVICRGCTVRRQCAALGLESTIPGMYGGIYLPMCGADRPWAKTKLRALAEGWVAPK